MTRLLLMTYTTQQFTAYHCFCCVWLPKTLCITHTRLYMWNTLVAVISATSCLGPTVNQLLCTHVDVQFAKRTFTNNQHWEMEQLQDCS